MRFRVRGVLPLALGLMCLPGSLAASPLTVTRAGLSVTLRDPADRAQLPRLFQVWEEARRDLKVKGLTLPAAKLTAARNAADFARLSGQGANISAITRNGQLYTQRLNALQGRGLLPYTVRHEAFHLAQPPGLPRWLAEGLARIFSGEAGAASAGHTAFAGLTDVQLSERLQRTGDRELPDLYREATRRAAQKLGRLGWRGTLQIRE